MGIAAGQGADCGLIHQVSGILVLAGTLGRDYIVLCENIHPLSAEHGVVICGGEGVGYIRLDAQPVAAILGLAVNGVASDTDDGQFFFLRLCRYQW